jgi:UPF0176 protein
MQNNTHYITTFYHFFPVENLESYKNQLEKKALELRVRGLIILGPEGFNSTVSSPSPTNLEIFKNFVCELAKHKIANFKDSQANKPPFRRFMVKIREEIVTLGTPELIPGEGINHHLSPEEWNQVMKNERDYVIIDTRNWYETKIGTFKGAINPLTDKFTEFPEFMDSQKIAKDKKVLIFCTGGIRCEKGILELQRQGYKNVFQLQGGILNYLKKFPNDQFEGECFVFDHRVAVDQNLAPSTKYKLCPHCGQPATTEVDCLRCDTHAVICEDCGEKLDLKDTCSKNCAYQWQLHPGRKGIRQIQPFELES